MNIGLALVQLALLPFVLGRPVLLAALYEHVVAVAAVETAVIVLQR